MTTNPLHPEPGARWLRCDLHVHTPFDGEKRFGVDIRGAIDAFKKADATRLASIAERFVEACRKAADGQGVDLVALTDHNSIEGYHRLKPQFDSIAQRARDDGKRMPIVLPSVEFSVGGERPIHFLVVFAADTRHEHIEGTIRFVFGEREPFDPKTGTPRATGESVGKFLEGLYKYTRPSTGERNLRFVVLPAHAEGDRGLAKETGVRAVGVATSLWDEMKGHLRQWAVSRTDWHGFETALPFERLPQAFQDLLLRWAAAKRGEDWNLLSESQRVRRREQRHWPLVECSDPHRYEAIGNRFTWLKMEVPDVEGIRLALLDPESRLRRMADGPPGRAYPRIQTISIQHTDFFEEIEIPFSPCLTTLIGGRGTGKSTVIEYLRHALDRVRKDDLPDDDPSNVREAVLSILAPKRERDFGHAKGTLLPDHGITMDVVVAERLYRVRRAASKFDVVQDPDKPETRSVPLDIRSLLVPRVLSQRQIARIARDPASQRSELDALIDPDRVRDIENRRRAIAESLAQLQVTRTRLKEQGAKLPSVETELQKVRDQIAFLEVAGRKEVLERFSSYERERGWLEQLRQETQQLAGDLDEAAASIESTQSSADSPPEDTPTEAWLRKVAQRVREARLDAAKGLRKWAGTLRTLLDVIQQEQAEQWQTSFEEARRAYDALKEEMTSRGVDFAQHAKLLQRRALLEREQASLEKTEHELGEIDRKFREARLQLVEAHESRLAARRGRARSLEDMDADVHLEVLGFRDREDFESRREQWFGGAGLQERDWTALCDYIFAQQGQIPERIEALVEAMRTDVAATASRGAPLDPADSAVGALIGADHLTRHFFRAIEKGERVRLDEMERFLPEDLVKAQVLVADGSFKTIETGSVGEKSTTILSLLLSAGDQPIIIDQPEDDLDNQYVYKVVVDLLRRRKFSRQVIIATHNANITVNGDAELIVALGVKDRQGVVSGAGSIDRPDIKELVSVILEGSAEAFRLRRERYGY